MLKKLRKNYSYFFLWGPAVSLFLLILLVLVPAIFSNNHYLFNLEPYPDGIWYALSARNLITQGELSFIYQDTTLQLPVPQLYPLFLSLGYLIWQAPQMFFISNILLLLATSFLLFLLIKKITNSVHIATISLGVYLSHAYILWLPSLPMTENLALLLLVVLLYFFFTQKISLRTTIAIALFSILLLFTRYSLIVTTLTSLALLAYKIFSATPQKSKKQLVVAGVFFGIVLLTVFAYFSQHYVVYVLRAVQEIINGSPFFGLHFIIPNTLTFIKTFLGFKNNFLWETTPLTTFPIFFFFLAGLYSEWKCTNYFSVTLLVAIFISILVAPVLFYSQDSRYIVLTLIPLVIGTAWFFKNLKLQSNKNKIIFYTIVITAFSFHLLLQRPLLQKIIASNVLHRSTAWQYEAIMHFNLVFKDIPNVLLITALPPYLVDAYTTENYRVLPLSQHQEFLDKKQRIWGSDVPYDDLFLGYENMLKQGKRLYITNAYITHNHAVIADYEQFTKKFTVVPIDDGCLDTCTVYQLLLK